MKWIAATMLLATASVVRAQGEPVKTATQNFVYVGTYTGTGSKGIYSYRFDSRTGQLTPIDLAAEQSNPSFLATDPHHRYLYAVTEMGEEPGAGDYKKNGLISSYAINPKTGALTFLNKVDALGSGSCHLVVDKTGKMLFVANYGSGSVASFAIQSNGSIGEKTGFDQHTGGSVGPRQKGPHAHAVVLSADNRFLFVPDLGMDQVRIYKVDAAKGGFSPNDPPFATVQAGLGPRHFAFGHGGKYAYVLCEMGSSVAAFAYNPVKGSLTPVETVSNLPTDFKGEDNSAEIAVDRSGRFLYASNRGHNSITVFAVDPVKGTLKSVQVEPTQGKIPRNFVLDPTGKYLLAANQNSNQIVMFAVDPMTGQLKPTGKMIDVPEPVSILFVPGT